MAPLTDEEQAIVRANILAELASTPYASTKLDRLTNGTTNFVFRGALKTPLPDGSKSVIIKHSTDFAAGNKDFPLDISRAVFEEFILDALNGFSGAAVGGTNGVFEAKVPRLYFSNASTHTQVLEDFPSAVDLKTALFASVDGSGPDSGLSREAVAHSIGEALGSWLRAFHTLTSSAAESAAESALRLAAEANEPMRKLKQQITYDALVRIVTDFPEVLKVTKPVLEAVQAAAAKELASAPESISDDEKKNWGIIHGDFWSANLLLSKEAPRPKEQQEIFVVDWEFAQFGHRAYDLGQLIGDLLERWHFRGATAALTVLDGFIQGYGVEVFTRNGNELAFRTAIHVGVQLAGFYIRRAPNGPLPGTPEKVKSAVQLATDLVVHGWQKDKAWLQKSVLAGLFGAECLELSS